MAIGIHPDDVEIGCGGTVALCAARGHDVLIVDLTRGESSSNGTVEQRAAEAADAARILGASRVNAGLPDTGVHSADAAQIRSLVGILRAHRPDVVLVPHADDPHPDHAAGALLARHAIFLANVNGYATDGAGGKQVRWKVARALVYPGRREVRPDAVVDVTAYYETKMSAIRAHASQVTAASGSLPTPLTDPRFLGVVDARDRLAGRTIGVTHGEAFELLAPVALDDLELLVRREP
ncbi:MAG: bacillithiol biosynthesis deacetylase BshB1 [Candidatus Krumholzibacteria bacterium]|nr:bacillithiol biosynthesis deacetylase BshB1 [Candidatus Krumholzibacteria bacterium]MDH4336354.1 bacillithiol biosynthesis deacetylase BshB1 [Candidatus Krumholzibacteria bacterium]MDH5269479.1 bacillithiol biosynthesis deacetylase BshB1 [Candidatus Krumholzibacteria bacterium]MDH5626836.1 bacillithiol biosynthesis deacetylase BshB1 [Candidatus Krumholzibacteria bacterium]